MGMDEDTTPTWKWSNIPLVGPTIVVSDDPVKHPDHYTWIPGIECMDVVRWFNFPIGAAIKYLWRCEHKGTKIQDLKKAIQCIEFEIEKEKKNDR